MLLKFDKKPGPALGTNFRVVIDEVKMINCIAFNHWLSLQLLLALVLIEIEYMIYNDVI